MGDGDPTGHNAPAPVGPLEIEIKLDASPEVLNEIEQLEEIDGWSVTGRRTVRLRDSYWDTPDRRLGRAGCTLRVRELDGAPLGELTFKGQPSNNARTEITASAPAGSTPADWERLDDTGAVRDALQHLGVLPDLLRPDVILLNPRRDLTLRKDAGNARRGSNNPGDAEVILSLDEVRLEGHPYVRHYVELELRHGARDALDSLARAIATRYGLARSRQGKVPAAREWLERQHR